MMRICKKYGMNEDGRIYNMQSGRELPKDEPVILFRAQDKHLPVILSIYAGMCRNEAHAFVVLDRKADVDSWQTHNKDRIKEPDTDLSDYDTRDVSDYDTRKCTQEDLNQKAECAEQQLFYVRVFHKGDMEHEHFNVIETEILDTGYLMLYMTEGGTAMYHKDVWKFIIKEVQQ